ncbi:hypothetical protein [Shewanella violacea]|uniref:Uncharacterized protein n=1 Tax=Shewanella violacea (strain JCM 10179 / CIP 106290 / LMG 19151 / DSS12) TaxID=637905 RepID=D4ZJF4_SHEVD|nr:hypothetical protein [Shewanella violacea]BAJ01803.1 hypothetical protein SVI_1832 [Shewanella violacea DSS12]
MSKLTKEEVISALESALTVKQGSTVTIEQKGSWYKIDGGKSLRFSDLETMLTEQSGGKASAEVVQTKAKPDVKKAKPKAAPAKKTKAKAITSSSSKGGKTPKELWREKLAGKGQLPRGF